MTGRVKDAPGGVTVSHDSFWKGALRSWEEKKRVICTSFALEMGKMGVESKTERQGADAKVDNQAQDQGSF